MDCVLTNAQYELLMLDVPVVRYDEKEGGELTEADINDAIARHEESVKRRTHKMDDFLVNGLPT
jgi:hypothetical protein